MTLPGYPPEQILAGQPGQPAGNQIQAETGPFPPLQTSHPLGNCLQDCILRRKRWLLLTVIVTICLEGLFMTQAPHSLNLERRNLKNLGLDHPEKKVLGLQITLLTLPGIPVIPVQWVAPFFRGSGSNRNILGRVRPM